MTGEDSSQARRPMSAGSAIGESPSGPANEGFDVQQIHAMARHPPPGASVYSPAAEVSSALNPRSCVTCRRRKVRCDKHMPCANCRRAHIPCIFPAPGRAPRRPRPKDPNAPPKHASSERELELLKRLRKLEGIVEDLSGQIELETGTGRHPSTAGNSPEAVGGHEADTQHGSGRGGFGAGDSAVSVGGSNQSQGSPSMGSATGKPSSSNIVASASGPGAGPLKRISSDVHKQFGRLVLGEKGVTRYVSSGFWSKINDELDEIRQETQKYTDDESDESDAEASPESAQAQDKSTPDHHSFIFGYRSADVDLRPLHPLPSQIPFIWQVYQENVDPILKILHVPSMNKMIRKLRTNMDSLTPSTEALMFSIYYAAITSLDEEEVKSNFGAEKDFLVQQYRFALEQALAKASFLVAPDLTVAQAFLSFLILVRRHDDTRFAWTLTGLLIRISQSLGLHRDGTNFENLTPFEVEMRRRVFWGLCILDLRSAEDQGTDLTIVDRTFDTQLPLNINDSDISPESTELPQPREGTTDMTFSLIRYEIAGVGRRLHTISSAMAPVCPSDAASSLAEREAMLLDAYRRVETKYLKDSSCEGNPMYWVAANIARVIVAKMTLVIYQPHLFPGPGNDCLSSEIRERLFHAAIDIFEYNYLLNTDPRCKQWRWLFQTYTQWHAVAYVLVEVAHRPWSATVERAWTALRSVPVEHKPFELEKMADHIAVWLPFKKLYLKAKKHREAEIARLRADPNAAQQLELEDRSRAPPETFNALPSSVKSAIAHERWRKLVNAPPLPPELLHQQQFTRQQQVSQSDDSLPSQRQQQQQQQHDTTAPITPRQDSATRQDQTQPTGPEYMDILDTVMNGSAPFNARVLPTLWSSGTDSVEIARSAVFGFSSGDIPRVDHNMAYATRMMEENNNGQTSSSFPSTLPPQHPSIMSMMASPPLKDDNPPPWLWPGALPGTDTGAGMSSEIDQFANVPGVVDDMDVNMDEGFDWQNWQESLNRFTSTLEASGCSAYNSWMGNDF
ncbi:fungal-specific transcription factor domain-containing protein [Diplogelasinospora grovesii]|uniref:Fungal-specific transcription factor domain-containing protein n=1 Tax=Diplogelasinospora grovesii TaxID=303347 RepID=A0AAN6N133_9PEZI|nr:fungal-specific transcription factor domain-containing protein [Diplogelasinospora grovesii]